MDELRPLEVAPLTTLLSTMAVTRVGNPNLLHLWASLKTTASSRILIWDSFLKVQAVSTLQSPEMAKLSIPTLSSPFESGHASSATLTFSDLIQRSKSRAMASAKRSVYVADALVYLPCTCRCGLVHWHLLSMWSGLTWTDSIRKLFRWGEPKRHESTLVWRAPGRPAADFQKGRCFNNEL